MVKHGISDTDMLDVASDPYVSYRIRSDPLKLLLLGFDSSARAIEVITDTGADGQIFIIHASKVTKQNERLFKE